MFLNSEVWNTIYKVSISYTSHPSSNAWKEAVTHEAGHSGINHACNEASIAFAMRLVQMPDHSLDAVYVEPPMSHGNVLGIHWSSCVSRKGGTGGGGWVHRSMQTAWLPLSLTSECTCAIIPILSANIRVLMWLRNRLSLQYCFSRCCINKYFYSCSFPSPLLHPNTHSRTHPHTHPPTHIPAPTHTHPYTMSCTQWHTTCQRH